MGTLIGGERKGKFRKKIVYGCRNGTKKCKGVGVKAEGKETEECVARKKRMEGGTRIQKQDEEKMQEGERNKKKKKR